MVTMRPLFFETIAGMFIEITHLIVFALSAFAVGLGLGLILGRMLMWLDRRLGEDERIGY